MKKLFTTSTSTSRAVVAGVIIAGVIGSAASLVVAQGTNPVGTATFPEQNQSLTKVGSLSLGRNTDAEWINGGGNISRISEDHPCLRQAYLDVGQNPETCLDVAGQAVFDYLAVDKQVNTLAGVNIGEADVVGTDTNIKLAINDAGANDSLLATNLARYTNGNLVAPLEASPTRDVCVSDTGVIILCSEDEPEPNLEPEPEIFNWVLGELGECPANAGVSSCGGTYSGSRFRCSGNYSYVIPPSCSVGFDILGGQSGNTVVTVGSAVLESANSSAECQELFNAYVATAGSNQTNFQMGYTPPRSATATCSNNPNAHSDAELCLNQGPGCSFDEQEITLQCSDFNVNETSCTDTAGCTWTPATAERTAAVSCQDAEGNVVDDSNCTEEKPSETVACGNLVTFAWDIEQRENRCPSGSSQPTKCVENPTYLDQNVESYFEQSLNASGSGGPVNYIQGILAGADSYSLHTVGGNVNTSLTRRCEDYSGTFSCNQQGNRCKLIHNPESRGTISRNITCKGSDGNTYGDIYCADAGEKPARSIACPADLVKTWSDGSEFEWDLNGVYNDQREFIGRLRQSCTPGQTGNAIANIETPFGAAGWFFPALRISPEGRRGNPAYTNNWTTATCLRTDTLEPSFFSGPRGFAEYSWQVPCDACERIRNGFERNDDNSIDPLRINRFTPFGNPSLNHRIGDYGNAYRVR